MYQTQKKRGAKVKYTVLISFGNFKLSVFLSFDVENVSRDLASSLTSYTIIAIGSVLHAHTVPISATKFQQQQNKMLFLFNINRKERIVYKPIEIVQSVDNDNR